MKNNIFIFIITLFISSCLIDERGVEYHNQCRPRKGNYNAKIYTSYGEYNSIVHNGFIEGDIKYRSNSAVAVIGKKWIAGVVPYKFAEGYKFKKRTKKALKEWERVTNGRLKFVQRENQKDYVKFISDDEGCWSYIGRIGGEQQISISSSKSCPKHVVVHEIGHALGLLHEHTRSDRDQFVQVNWCNIEEDKLHNFKMANSYFSIDFGEYDSKSIMHYSSGTFSKNRYKTIQGVNGNRVNTVNNMSLTEGDIQAVVTINELE